MRGGRLPSTRASSGGCVPGERRRTDLADRPGGPTWRPDLAARPGGPTWRTDLAARPGGPTWRTAQSHPLCVIVAVLEYGFVAVAVEVIDRDGAFFNGRVKPRVSVDPYTPSDPVHRNV